MIVAHALQNVKAEITCARCPSPVQLHQEELQLGIRTDPTEEASTLKNIRVEFRELGVTDNNTGMDGDNETGVSAEDAPHFTQYASLDGVSTQDDTPRSSEESRRGSDQPDVGEDAALQRAKRSGPEFAEFAESGLTDGVDAFVGAPVDRGSMLDGHRQGRSGFRWNRDEGRGNNRQDEPKITSSTFALTGDSAHNHAVVYWSGQNSSVSTSTLCYFISAASFWIIPDTLHTNSARRVGYF